MQRHPLFNRGTATVVALAVVALAGCGSDTKQSTPSSAAATVTVAGSSDTNPNTEPLTTTAADSVDPSTIDTATGDTVTDTSAVDISDSSEAAATFDRDGYCAAEVALEEASSAGGDPDADPVGFATTLLSFAQTSQGLAPAELAADFETAVGALQSVVDTNDPSALQNLDTSGIHQYDAGSCPWTGENVEMKDYEFVNLPETLVAGDYDFELSNQADEPHVMVIVKKKDGVTASWDELLASPDAESMVETVAAGFTPPGGSGYVVTHLDAGEYLALCPISQGSTGDTEGTGPPHFTLGMHQVITVAAG